MSIDTSITSVIKNVRCLIKDQSTKRVPGDVWTYDTDLKFTLCESYVDEATIMVFINGEALTTSDFTFDPDTNQVCIDIVSSGSSINKGDTVLITYNFFCKYSDQEIKDYISCSFAYFVENRYSKVFMLNDDDKICSLNEYGPTVKELLFIAIITSILVDPMNVDIKIDGGFSIKAQRDKSDRAQISEAFTRFQKVIGDISVERFFDHDNRNLFL